MRFARFLLPLLALGFLAGASKPKLMIRFHTEADPTSGSAFTVSANMPNSTKPLTISKVPEISEADILAIFPFPADDGTLGCSFKLNTHGRIVLDSLSQESRGSVLLGIVNGRVVTAMVIDRRVSDGVISIARGLTPYDMAMMQKAFPTLTAKKAAPAAGPAPASKTKAAAALSTAEPAIVVPPPLPNTRSLPRGD